MILSNGVFYIHVPKTGGTSLEKSFAQKDRTELTKHSTLEEYRTFFLEKANRETLPPCFSIVRNPYERFFSYFASHVHRKRWCPKKGHPKGKGLHRMGKAFPKKSSFRKWMIEVYDGSLPDFERYYGPNKVNDNIYKYYYDNYSSDIDYFLLTNLSDKKVFTQFLKENSYLLPHGGKETKLRVAKKISESGYVSPDGKPKISVEFRNKGLGNNPETRKHRKTSYYEFYDDQILEIFERRNKEDIHFYLSLVENDKFLSSEQKSSLIELPPGSSIRR